MGIHGDHDRKIFDTDHPHGLRNAEIEFVNVEHFAHSLRCEGGSPADGMEIDGVVLLTGLQGFRPHASLADDSLDVEFANDQMLVGFFPAARGRAGGNEAVFPPFFFNHRAAVIDNAARENTLEFIIGFALSVRDFLPDKSLHHVMVGSVPRCDHGAVQHHLIADPEFSDLLIRGR